MVSSYYFFVVHHEFTIHIKDCSNWFQKKKNLNLVSLGVMVHKIDTHLMQVVCKQNVVDNWSLEVRFAFLFFCFGTLRLFPCRLFCLFHFSWIKATV